MSADNAHYEHIDIKWWDICAGKQEETDDRKMQNDRISTEG